GPMRATTQQLRSHKPLVIGAAAAVLLLTTLLAWGAFGSERSNAAAETSPVRVETPRAAAETPVVEPRATAVNDKPVAQPVTVVPIEPEPEAESPPAEPAEPAEAVPSVESNIETAVAHVPRAPARKRPTTKPASKRRPA